MTGLCALGHVHPIQEDERSGETVGALRYVGVIRCDRGPAFQLHERRGRYGYIYERLSKKSRVS